MNALLEKIKKNLRPDTSILKEVDVVTKKINELLKKHNIKAVCVSGGSTAKGTFLKNDYDVDLFVRFDYSYKDQHLSDILETALKGSFKFERVHGSRDYFQIKNKLLFEIVPVLNIKNYKQALNVTDMSPLHVDYVKKKVNKLTDDIRLVKQFCKSANVYGAESYIKGFSGHILDLLIINYGSFEKLVKHACNWKPKVVIDIEKHLKNPLEELDDAKIHSPLIIVDPVQPDRNAAAALSKDKFDEFIERCKAFLLNPNKQFFEVKHLDKEKVARKVLPDEELHFIEAAPLKGKNDVVGAKIMKAYEYIKRSIKKNDFHIVNTNWEFRNKGLMYFIIRKETLSDKVVVRGPPTTEKEGLKRFKAKHKKTFFENKRIFAEEKRKYSLAKDLIRDLLKDEYVVERVKKITEIEGHPHTKV